MENVEKIVNQKLDSGDIFSRGSPGQASSDAQSGVNLAPTGIALKNLKGKKPWNDKKFVEASNKNKRADNYGNMNPSNSPNAGYSSQPERRTIGQKLQAPLDSGIFFSKTSPICFVLISMTIPGPFARSGS